MPGLFERIAREMGHLGLRNWICFKLAIRAARWLPKGTLVRVPVRGSMLHARARTSDLSVFYQIFVEREYRCLDHVREARSVIDCGANVGYSAAYFLSRFPGAHVVAIEPDEENFALLGQNLQQFGDRVTLHKAGVWSSSTGLVISNPKADHWSFVVREAAPGETASIRALDIPTLLREVGGHVDILKVDIEGSEREVFRDAPWLGQVSHLVIELHGADCETVVMQAVDGRAVPSRCDELTVFDFSGARRAA